MKKILTILFICLLQNGFAQTTHYISTTGSDANNGTIGSPWKTVHYAATQVSTPGDTIYINSGTYIETQPAMIAVGVSIKGADSATTIVKSHYVANFNFGDPSDAAISFVSGTEGTNGNQSLSGITLDGDNLTGTLGIIIKLRSNVIIHNIKIKDFYINGIGYYGCSVNSNTKPNTYSTGNQLYNFTITNCTDTAETYVGGGNINICGQKDLLIHDFVLADTSRGVGANGDNIVNNRYGLGLKIYNGTSYKPSSANAGWNFHFEIPWGAGGTEIYNVKFYGGDYAIDVGGNVILDNNYTYLFDIHDNYIEDTNPSVDGTYGKYAFQIEGDHVKNIKIRNNTLKNVARMIGLNDGGGGTVATDSNIVVSGNVCMNMGLTAVNTYQSLIEINKTVSGGGIYVFSFINNTILPNSTVHASTIAITNSNCTMRNINISNNIAGNGTNGYWMTVNNTNGTFDSLILRNNDVFNNDGGYTPNFTGNAITNYINSGNITSDPLLISSTDYHLQSGSPAIGAGYNYGYGVDIGALQYTSTAPTISVSADQNITVSNTSISAVGTPYTGHTITGYSWTRTQGTGTITNPNSASTSITGMSNGVNKFQCTVTQDDGQTASATVNITVTLPTNVPPTANAGTDQTITLPTSQVTLTGSGTDSDGSIASYSWSKVSGGTATITSATSATTTVTGLAAGVYVFRLTVTDNQGATGTDDVQITVNNVVQPPNAYIKLRVPTKFINK